MFLPIGDTPNPEGHPPVTYLLIAVNVLIFVLICIPLMGARPDLHDPMLLKYLDAAGVQGRVSAQAVFAQVSAFDLFLFRYGFRPDEPALLTAFTSMFLHGGWLHLGSNMLFLWIFGNNVEVRLGSFGYLLAYVVSGLLSVVFFSLFSGNGAVPLVGASGAISGVLGCYFVWFKENRVKVFVFLFPFLVTTMLISARLVLGCYILIDNLLPFLFGFGKGGGVAYGAHIGGFLAGAVLAWGLSRLASESSTVAVNEQGDIEGFTWHVQDPPDMSKVQEVRAALDQGNLSVAAREYMHLEDVAGRLGIDDVHVLRMAELFAQQGDQQRAMRVLRRFIADRPGSAVLDQVYLLAGRMMLATGGAPAAARQYLLMALDTARSEAVADEARRLLRQAD